MRKILFFGLVFFSLIGCQAAKDAEKTANLFHEKLDLKEYSFILENLIDEEALNNPHDSEEWGEFFQGIEQWGEMRNREKSTGFNYNSNNGISNVKLNYTFEADPGKIYEVIVLVDRGKGYKVKALNMNSDKSVVDVFEEEFE